MGKLIEFPRKTARNTSRGAQALLEVQAESGVVTLTIDELTLELLPAEARELAELIQDLAADACEGIV